MQPTRAYLSAYFSSFESHLNSLVVCKKMERQQIKKEKRDIFSI
jgi:hypothetical protein